MTLYQFNALSEKKQLGYLRESGIFLMSRPVGKSYVRLYALDLFFVEIRYDRALNEITACRSFRSSIPLEPYISGISLETDLTNPSPEEN